VKDEHNVEVARGGAFLKNWKLPTTSKCEARPIGIAVDAHGHIWTTNTGSTAPVDEFTETGELLKTVGKGVENLSEPGAIAIDNKGDVFVEDATAQAVLEFNENGTYESSSGTAGTGPAQLDLTHLSGLTTDTKHHLLITDTGNNRVERWLFPTQQTGNTGAHTTQTIYYTAASRTLHPNCGEHAEWAGLPCEAQRAKQPESGLPALPVTTYTYNIWDEPLTTTDTISTTEPKTERTTTITYDAAGRPETTKITSNLNGMIAVPQVTDEYSKTNGLLVKQSSSTGNLTSEYNTLGQLTSYADALGNITKYEYEKEGDRHLTKVNDDENGTAASTDTYTYNTTTGGLESIKDAAGKEAGAGTFTVTRDPENNITSESYTNGITAKLTYNSINEQVGLEYADTAHCTTNCTAYSDTVTPSIHGQWVSQTSTLSKQTYAYDQAGRLIEVQETPSGKGCTSRLYAYDEDGNRTSLTTREPATEGKCATEGGTSENYAYDTANRLDETAVSYDEFGNTTALPAAYAGGTALTSSFYVNDMPATLEQGGKKLSYALDPSGRILETTSKEGATSTTIDNHYAGAEATPAWSSNPATGSWTRYIGGVGGGLSAIETKGTAPELELADLHGDIIGTAKLSETEPKIGQANETSEYGVPRTTITAKYSWLGEDKASTELPTGVINMGARTYIPQIGRFLQTDPQPGGSVNGYAYTFDDPVNEADSSGEWTNYDYENAQTGEAAPGTLRDGNKPGAIEPPPADYQAEELLAAEIDPTRNGEYGHLHVTYKVLRCDKEGCEGRFVTNGVITDRGNRKSEMQLSITAENAAWPSSEPYAENPSVAGVSTPTYYDDIYIPFGTVYTFSLSVTVGKHSETLKLSFASLGGEITY
jgi:RHS repeat-associated protein